MTSTSIQGRVPARRWAVLPRRRGAAGRGGAAVATPVGDRWYVDETYVKVGGRWRYVRRAVDQHGHIIDIYVSAKRDSAAARRFFQRAIASAGTAPAEVVTDRAPVYPKLLDELVPAAWHHGEQYGNNRIEADHGN